MYYHVFTPALFHISVYFRHLATANAGLRCQVQPVEPPRGDTWNCRKMMTRGHVKAVQALTSGAQDAGLESW